MLGREFINIWLIAERNEIGNDGLQSFGDTRSKYINNEFVLIV